MSKSAVFTAELLSDGHLSIPEMTVKVLLLKKGARVKATIETQQFDKAGFLKLAGIWRNKVGKEIDIYREIFKERDSFGRGEVNY
ncbi:MAG: hypothetical protein M0R70_00015 [Nitrospirae bacterium]|nr:hypothetical protein [Nitrospirota bacterium]